MRNQYIPPSFPLPLFPQVSSHLPSAPSHLYLGAPSRFCSLSASSVLELLCAMAPVASAGQVFVGEQTDLCVYPSTDGSAPLRVAAGAINIQTGSTLTVMAFCCPQILSVAVEDGLDIIADGET